MKKLKDVYEVLNPDVGYTIYLNDLYTAYCEDRNYIGIQFLDDDLDCISIDEDGFTLHLYRKEAGYGELDARARINLLDKFVNVICPYEDFGYIEVSTVEQYMICFQKENKYSFDRHGNWFDSDGRIVE